MSDSGHISDASEMSLAAAPLTVSDNAAAALVRHYAALMDHAVALRDEVDLAWGSLSVDDIDGRRRLVKLEAAVSAQAVASDLGPKLLAALTALGCTPAGRGVKGQEKPVATDPKRVAHDEIKARRERRQNGTAAMDATP